MRTERPRAPYNNELHTRTENVLFLKTLEISGFKSFARPVRFDFTPGITALVGPNGSGKSNVVDAVRWCLGEQSMRDLRGQSAQDVIYAGPRRSLGLAEVRMSFERARDDGPDVPDELVVARRLYRSGESEYLLDGRRARLRDVADAIRAIGIDTGEHVVVNQGMADALLSASPLDRRGLLEQAAGLAGYRVRRDEARGKLAVTRRNVDTIQTVLAEMEPRLRMLRRQARAVTERDEAKKRLRVRLELYLSHCWNAVNSDVQALERRREQLSTQRAAALAYVRQLERQADTVHAAERAWQREMDVASSALHGAERDHDRALHVLSGAEQRLEGLQDAVKERAARLAVRREAWSGTDDRIIQLQRDIEAINRDLLCLRRDEQRAKEVATRLDARLASLASEIADRASAARRARETAANAEHALDTAQGRLREAQERGSRLEGHIREAEERVPALQKEMESVEHQIAEGTADLQRAAARRDSALIRLELAVARSTRLDRIHGRLRQTIADIARRAEAARRAQHALEPSVSGSPYERLRAARGWEDAVAAGIAGWSGDPLQCDLPGFLQWRKSLQLPGGQCLVWGETVVSNLEGPSPLHGAILVEGEGEAESVWKAINRQPAYHVGSPSVAVITRKGTTYNGRGVTEPDVTDWGARFLRLRRETQSLQERLQTLEYRLTAVARMRNVHERTTVAAREGADASREELRRVEEALVRRTVAREALEHRRNALLRDVDEWRQEMGAARAETERRTTALSEAQTEAKRARLYLESVTSDTEKDDQTLHSARTDLSQAEREVALIVQKAETLATRSAAYQGMLNDLYSEKARGDAERDRLEREVAVATELDTSLREEIAAAGDAVRAAHTRLEEARANREDIARRKPAHDMPGTALQHARAKLNDVLPEYERVVAKLEQRGRDRDVLAQQIAHELGAEVPLEALEDADVPTEEEIRRLRARAGQYADADESVIVEAEELEERFTYLQRHAEDLESAADDLQEIMNGADRDMQGRFGTAFRAVNSEFSRVFEVMLRGGRARLIEASNGGVDIEAQLPGKKARSSAAFSGGERSLVASSLLFGVLRIRPTPFCVLDEVDAALDESNVDRYLEALRDISARTQAIVVTHNRATMAAAHMLYGMTMDDEGVSSLLSLRLDAFAAG